MVRFSLRIPSGLYQALVNDAKREHRSTNQQIVAILEAALAPDAWVAEDYPVGPEPPEGGE